MSAYCVWLILKTNLSHVCERNYETKTTMQHRASRMKYAHCCKQLGLLCTYCYSSPCKSHHISLRLLFSLPLSFERMVFQWLSPSAPLQKHCVASSWVSYLIVKLFCRCKHQILFHIIFILDKIFSEIVIPYGLMFFKYFFDFVTPCAIWRKITV